MPDQRMMTVIVLVGLLLGGGPVLGQASTLVTAAEEKVEAGDYPGALELYERAARAAGGAQRPGIQEKIDDTTKLYYADLHQQAVASTSRDEKIELLIKAKSLDIRRWHFTDFEQTVIAVRKLTDEIFAELRAEAETAAGEKAYDSALSLYKRAREFDSYLYDVQNLSAQYEEIEEQVRIGEDLAREGHRLIAQKKYSEAKAKFRQAALVHPALETIDTGIREAESMLILIEGKGYAESNQFDRAENAFETAVQEYENNEAAARLLSESRSYKQHVRNGRILYKQESCDESKRAFREAQMLNRRRFRHERLEALLAGDCTQMIPLPMSETRQALSALFDSQPEQAIRVLELLLEEVGEDHPKVHAFLGVAYCYSAFMSQEEDAAALENAKEHFRKALRSRPDYRLSEKLFSPRIRQIFEEQRSQLN